ncbi:nucleotide exchange factor GrpE [Actinomadura sp. DC4]|uniref:nucleotide exchange factor GrpE n=1 Tax=Actinomadura sp. DC4 TaxID=3055069 RepID=UPI0025B15604|nr:nucleotide exchange factor GrpE [Actinomadura sp. DC4]MDN3351986.1 nucleotide exchange factor GrpE [Actinomadura sp. DC4]
MSDRGDEGRGWREGRPSGDGARAESGEPRNWPPDPAEEAAARRPSGEPDEDSAAKIAELEDKWRRALADLDNYRKRTARMLDGERAEERARTSAAWLPVLDDLERALEHADADPATVIEGVRSVLGQAREVIARLGYRRRDDEGVPFDPALHEAVSTVADPEAADGTVVHVLRPGYGGERGQLRPAQVVVAKGHGDGRTS